MTAKSSYKSKASKYSGNYTFSQNTADEHLFYIQSVFILKLNQL